MKRVVYLFIFLFALVSCAKESSVEIDNGLATSVKVIFNGFENEDQTKATINTALGLAWASGDVMGVWPLTVDQNQVGTQLAFTLTGNTGTGSTTFTGSGWGMICDGNYQYTSYFPYSASCASADSISASYPTCVFIQKNSQTNHMNDYLYMYAPSIAPGSTTEATFNFYQLGALAKFEIAPTTGINCRKITISAADNVFSTSATYSLNKAELNGTTIKPTITSTPSERYLGAVLNNFFCSSSKPLELYFAMCPAKLAGKTLTVKLYDEYDNMYTGTINCTKDQESGKTYTYSATVSPASKPTVDYATIEGVDLGIGVLFAPFNLGATSPEENGLLFAYGETETKTSYTWDNYTAADTTTQFNSKIIYQNKSYINASGKSETRPFFDESCDAAAQTWGNGWMVPTYGLTNELQLKCDKEWVTYNGIQGYKLYNASDHSKFIFIPATTANFNSNMYWTTFNTSTPSGTYCWLFTPTSSNIGRATAACKGLYIRPVKMKSTN